MRENIGKRFRVRYMWHISKLKYEIVAEKYDGYVIGFNNNEIEKNDLIKENDSCLEIE